MSKPIEFINVKLRDRGPRRRSNRPHDPSAPKPADLREPRLQALAQDRLIGLLGAVGLFCLALYLRLWNLGRPKSFAFDETYYAKDAWSLLNFGYSPNYIDKADKKILKGNVDDIWTDTPQMVVHPEVGKWLIATGEHLFGMNPFGWRFASAVVGALMVVVMMRLARRVTGSTTLGIVAGLLLCLDGLHLVLSRMAILDIFQAFFILSAVSCMVVDRDWVRSRLIEPVTHPNSWGPRLWWRPWRLATGIMWGLAIGVKWSSLYPLAAFGILMWLWDAGARRRIGVRMPLIRSAFLDALPALGYVVVVPLLIYIASWTGWLMNAHVYEVHLANTQYTSYWGDYTKTEAQGFFGELTQGLRSLWHYHQAVYSFHTGHLNDATHVYQSKPWGWLLLNRPVGVDAQLDIQPGDQGCTAPQDSTCLRQVILLGNPIVWWLGALSLLWASYAWVRKRDWRYGFVLVGVASTWLPWFMYAERPIFSYYSITILPFTVLGATLLLGEILGRAGVSARRRRVGAIIATSILLAVVVAFAWFWPIWTDILITNDQWSQRMWFRRWI